MLNAAWHDEPEEVEVGRHVEREPVARNPSGDAHTDSTYLVGTKPRAREPIDSARFQTKVAGRANHDVFQIAHILVHIAPIGAEIENGIAHNLPWAVVCNVAAATRFMDFYVPLGQQFRRGKKMRPRGVGFHAERYDVGVFEQKQQVRDAISATLFDEAALQVARCRVGDDPKPPDF